MSATSPGGSDRLVRYTRAVAPPVLPDRPLTWQRAAQTERVLGVARAFLTITALLAIYLDPTEPPRLQALTYSVLLGYALYSVGVLAYVNRVTSVTGTHGRVLHGLDVLWTAALIFVSDAPVSPFFLFFMFVLLAAAYRWGFKETAGTAAITIGILLLEYAVASAGPAQATWFGSTGFDLSRTILRVAYLSLTGVLLGYLAEQDKHSRAELAAIAAAAGQPRVHLGLGGSVAALARTLTTAFDAKSVAVVVHDLETGRTFFWSLDGSSRTPSEHLQRTELSAEERLAWLFDDFGRTWHATRTTAEAVSLRLTEPDAWPLVRQEGVLPRRLVASRPFTSLTAVNMGLDDEWQARAYLFDIRTKGGLDRRMHFLEALAEHITPALTNVFLLSRLRARAGAAERARVARELHDGAIQTLYGIDMKIAALRRNAHSVTPDADAELDQVQNLIRREVLDLRRLMQALRPIELDSSDQLPEVLTAVVERFRRDTGLCARFTAGTRRIALPPATALEVVRIVQEALVNVRKHSRARNVWVRLSDDEGRCRVVIEDDGCGFAFEGRLSGRDLDERRIGPAIIRERARVAGADLAVDSTPGAGARVEVTFMETLYA